MSTSPMAARECWIYGECSKIRMMVPGAAAPGNPVSRHNWSDFDNFYKTRSQAIARILDSQPYCLTADYLVKAIVLRYWAF